MDFILAKPKKQKNYNSVSKRRGKSSAKGRRKRKSGVRARPCQFIHFHFRLRPFNSNKLHSDTRVIFFSLYFFFFSHFYKCLFHKIFRPQSNETVIFFEKLISLFYSCTLVKRLHSHVNSHR